MNYKLWNYFVGWTVTLFLLVFPFPSIILNSPTPSTAGLRKIVSLLNLYYFICGFEHLSQARGGKGNCDENKNECSMALTVFYGQTLRIKSRSLRWDIKKPSLKFLSPTIANLLCRGWYCDLFVPPSGYQLQKKAFAFYFLFNTEWRAFE